ncbi:MAG: discoidin protein [Pedosphaera sp.]|nr:discoidin protein [Pedosphaera sp.]
MVNAQKHMLTNISSPVLHRRLALCVGLVALALSPVVATNSFADDAAKPAVAKGMKPLEIKLPPPAFVGTPKDAPAGTNIEPLSDKPRPLLIVPDDVVNLAPGKTITSSDTNATAKVLAKLTDGLKETSDSTSVLLRKGVQYVQFDLGSVDEIYAIVFWHAHDAPKVFHDVIVQVSEDPGFKDKAHTLFNNDVGNVAGLGAGTDREYFETNEGRLVDAKGIKARYVRLYSQGSTDGRMNEYTEVEIYGRPAK